MNFLLQVDRCHSGYVQQRLLLRGWVPAQLLVRQGLIASGWAHIGQKREPRICTGQNDRRSFSELLRRVGFIGRR